ncbi:HlyB/MsbA family ABC transporter [Multifurca ochricompacta]|uniref:HlyB/MsbA family ABC transporter n=1 Tax=Multifurca ochricompacta TaxID=376703 RepID=A0AAD4QNK9_9AGAM|nr:HlyB/MsbA family ABC transporter [Multifurca ochricompacta]
MVKDSSKARDRCENDGAFDPHNGKIIEHRKLGVWDLYVERDRMLSYFPTSWKLEEYAGIWNDVPYLWRTIYDMGTVAWPMLLLFLAVAFARSLVPALNLWFSGQLLVIVQNAVDKRALDAHSLFQIAGGRVLCAAAEHILNHASNKMSTALDGRSRQFYSTHIFHAMARLDVPTLDDPNVAGQINALTPRPPHTPAWGAIVTLVDTGSAFLMMFSQTAVLLGVLRDQKDGLLLTFLSLAGDALSLVDFSSMLELDGAWAATSRNEDFVRMAGLKRLVKDPKHRKEFVAGGLTEYLTAEYRGLADRLGSHANDFWSTYMDAYSDRNFQPVRLLKLPLGELPQIVFTLRAVQQPSSIPVSLTSLHLVQGASNTFMMHFRVLLQETGTFSKKLSTLRKLYESGNIPNKVVDGTTPFPENNQSIRDGISLEFRKVSFRYPGSESYALRDVSFAVKPGQLCVIIGTNGSGKSTILKLVARIYDPTEGTILIGGYDIKTMRLADLRRAMAILFQDYTHFPLTIRENIALGDPAHAHDDAAIEQAARLGGASELISRLPDGFDTYLERPVPDIYSGLPEGTTTVFGRKIEKGQLRNFMNTPTDHGLSGGQMQRLAVARTFMRSLSAEKEVGLLLFDEPSASLDPNAEQDLFSRLRELRGNKTMIFSSHRFGNLTRHADLILYMDDATIIETGTHVELLKREGSDYARLWHVQAQAFL